MEALAIDFKNFDAFDALVGGEMMTIDEGTFASLALLNAKIQLAVCRVGLCSGTPVSSR
jgi:hypothetical protein